MARTTDRKTLKAYAMLNEIHPKYPERRYTVYEAASKHKVALSTLYRHINKQEAALQAKIAAEQMAEVQS